MVQIKPSLLYDAICFLEQRINIREENAFPLQSDQHAMIERMLTLFGDKLSPQCFGMSSFAALLSYYSPASADWSLDEAIAVLSETDAFCDTVDRALTNDWARMYSIPLLEELRNGGAVWLCRDLAALRDGGFADIWQNEIRPLLERDCAVKARRLEEENIDAYLTGCAMLRKEDVRTDVTVYVSYMSHPVSFAMPNGFLTERGDFRLAQLLGHECMHSFSDADVIAAYRTAVTANAYLIEQHRRLLEDYHSGDEEELVLAAEYYIAYRAGKPYDSLLQKLKSWYGGCCPTAVLLFDALVREEEPVTDYNAWLRRYFATADFTAVTADRIAKIGETSC